MPSLVAVVLVFILTDILYTEGKRNSLAGQSEKFFIELSLGGAAYDAENTDKLTVVSLSDTDGSAGLFDPDAPSLRDATLTTYSEVLQAVLKQDPALVILSWIPGAHDPSQMKDLVDVIKNFNASTKVIIGYPIKEIGQLSPDLMNLGVVREGEDCVYDVNSYCSVNPLWKTWLIQTLVERVWPNPLEGHISTNLPHVYPNFLLNIPRQSSLKQLTFTDVLTKNGIAYFRDQIVVIGNAVTQPQSLLNNKTLVRRTKSVENGNAVLLGKGGTPLHVFWAQILQMFADHATVKVVSLWASRLLMIIISLIVLFAMYRFGPGTTFVLFLVCAGAAPWLNSLAVKYLHAYLPISEIIYGGSLTFIFATFARLSFSRYKYWNLAASRKSFENAADLKSNFISLISHNLNTPIAKLQGLLEVMIKSENTDSEVDRELRPALELVISERMLVKSILVLTTIEQQGVGRSRLTAQQLKTEFDTSLKWMLKSYGITTETTIVSGQNVDIYLDRTVVCLVLGNICALMRSDNASDDVKIAFAVTEKEDHGARVEITLDSSSGQISSETSRLIVDGQGSRHSRRLESESFYLELLVKFVHFVAHSYDGTFEIRRFGPSPQLKLFLESKLL